MAEGQIGSGRRTGPGRKAVDTRGYKQKIEDAVSNFFGSIPTGVKPGGGSLHTIDDATDELRQYNTRKGKK
jgi:hypothetical protein